MKLSNFEENKKGGFVKSYRSLLDWEWFTDFRVEHFYHYCLLRANYEDRNYRGELIKRGSFATSLEKMSVETGLSIQEVRTCLKKLEKTGYLTNAKSKKGTIISVENYSIYQDATHKSTYNQHTEQQDSNKISTTNKKLRNKEVVGVAEAPPNYTPHFVRFYEAYPRKGYKKDTFEYWCENGFEEMDIDTLVKACERYEKAMDSKVDAMVYPRTFLMDDIYQTYMRKSVEELEREERLREHEEQLKEFKRLGIEN